MDPELFRVTPTIHCVRRPSYFTCSYVLSLERGVVLVDAGMKSDGSDVLFALDQLGHTPTDVIAIALTHWHNDHSAGADEVARLANAEVCYAEAEAPYLTRATANDGLFGWLSDAIPEAGPLVLAKGLLGSAPMRAVEATRFVGEGDVIADELVVLETPGHTEGHISFLYPRENVLFAGDALAYIDGELRLMARVVTPDLEAARRSAARLLDVPFSTVCPGHRTAGPVDPDDLARFRRFLLESDDWPALG